MINHKKATSYGVAFFMLNKYMDSAKFKVYYFNREDGKTQSRKEFKLYVFPSLRFGV